MTSISVADVTAYMRDYQERVQPRVEAVLGAADWRERLNALRALYANLTDDEVSQPSFCAYDLGVFDLFTPIEQALWQSIRLGNLRAIPQYPVGPYVVDFAVVGQRIAIEADGQGYHDQVKDAARDEALYRNHGWRVFRLTGSECYRTRPAPWELREGYRDSYGDEPDSFAIQDGVRAYYWTTACGLIRAITLLLVDKVSTQHQDFAVMLHALEQHRLAGFPLGRDW